MKSYIQPVILILMLLVSWVVFPHLPEIVATHWNLYGEPDGYSSKIIGLLSIPILTLIVYLVLLVIPVFDPLKNNINSFKRYYFNFITIFLLFMLYLFLLVIVWNLGYRFAMTVWLSPAFSLLFYYAGILMEHTAPNWSIGIRTPWTMSSEKVWSKTHHLAGKLYKYSALGGIFGIFIGFWGLILLIIAIFLESVLLVAFSYYWYKHLR